MLAFAAKRTIERVFCIATVVVGGFAHLEVPYLIFNLFDVSRHKITMNQPLKNSQTQGLVQEVICNLNKNLIASYFFFILRV